MSISVSAPGKVHLIGEHAVVYGVPAIIAAIENRCRVTAEEHDKIKIESVQQEKKLQRIIFCYEN